MTSPERRLQRIAASFNARARRYHSPGVVSWHQLAALGDTCYYCGITMDLEHGTWDHKESLEKGGSNYLINIVRCCMTCQRTKFTKTPDEHRQAQELVVACVNCGKQFKPRWAEYQRGVARTCSHACAGAMKGKK